MLDAQFKSSLLTFYGFQPSDGSDPQCLLVSAKLKPLPKSESFPYASNVDWAMDHMSGDGGFWTFILARQRPEKTSKGGYFLVTGFMQGAIRDAGLWDDWFYTEKVCPMGWWKRRTLRVFYKMEATLTALAWFKGVKK